MKNSKSEKAGIGIVGHFAFLFLNF